MTVNLASGHVLHTREVVTAALRTTVAAVDGAATRRQTVERPASSARGLQRGGGLSRGDHAVTVSLSSSHVVCILGGVTVGLHYPAVGADGELTPRKTARRHATCARHLVVVRTRHHDSSPVTGTDSVATVPLQCPVDAVDLALTRRLTAAQPATYASERARVGRSVVHDPVAVLTGDLDSTHAVGTRPVATVALR